MAGRHCESQAQGMRNTFSF